MIIKANIKEAVQSLWGSKQRTVLALVGIFVGIGSVIAMVSVGTIVQNEALRQFKEMGTDVLTIAKSGEGGPSRGRDRGIDLRVASEIPQWCPEIQTVAPYTSIYGTLKYEGKKFEAPALGVTQSFMDLAKLKIQQGRFISDLDHFMYYCVIGTNVQEQLRSFGVKNPLGTRLIFKDKLFTVVGTIEYAPPSGMRPYEVSQGMLIPITVSRRLGEQEGIGTVIAKMKPGGDHVTATSQIENYFDVKGNGMKVRVQSAEELIAQMQKQMRLFTLLLGAIGSISLLVGGVGVMNVMLVSVTERKKEIGIRRALGAKQGDIQGQFIIESIILCMLGGFLGVALGVWASYVIAHFSKWEFLISYHAVMLGVAVSVTVGLFFGYYPARQASRLNPIEALRAE